MESLKVTETSPILHPSVMDFRDNCDELGRILGNLFRQPAQRVIMFWFAALVILVLPSVLLLAVRVYRHHDQDYDASMPDLDGL